MRPTTLLSRLGSEPGFTPTDRRSLERLTSRLPEATVAQLLGDRELRARAAELVSTNELILLFHSLSKWVRAEVPEPASASLSDYARNHGVAWCLDCKLERLAESGGSASFLVDRLRSARIGTVGALLDSRGLQGYLEPLRKQLAEIADKFVRKQVALVAEAVIHAPLTAPLPDHVEAARKQLWHHLHELSESLREHVTPRPTTERLTGELRLSEDPPVLTRFSRERSGSHSFNTLVPLRADVGQALACSCTAASPAVCDHALALVEDLMNAVALREPKSTAWVDGVVQSAAIAPWQRVLQALDSLARAPGEAVQALGFVVGRRSGGVYLKLIADDPESPGKGNELDAEDALAFAQLPSERAALAALEQHRHDVYDGDAIGPALAQLAGHPRVYLQVRGKRRSLQVRRGDVALAARPNPDGTVTLSLTAGGRDLGDAELEDVRSQRARRTSVAIDEAAGICTVVDTDPRLARVWATIERHGAVLPAEAASALLARLPALSESVPVDVSPELLGREVPAEPRFVLRLAPWEQDGVEAWVGVRALPGAPVHPVGSGPGIVHAHEPGVPLAERRYARRDLADERTLATERLAPLALAPIAEGAPMSWRIAGDAALELLEALRGLAGAVDVEWPDGQTRRVHAAGTGALSYRVTEGRDWFGLEGEIEIDGDRVALAALLEALRGGRRYVRVGAHDWLRISDELRARLGLVAQVAQPTRHGLELPALAAPALAETLAGAVQPVRWQKLIARAHAAESFTPEVPAGLGVTLRDYQVHGYEWLMRLCEWAPGGCLADDMGLGKTIQALALLAARADRGPALVVAPTSVCFNWVREAERVAPMLRVRMGRESDVAPTELGPGDLYIVSYGIMVKDLESLKQQRFATLIVDEAQALKNPASQRARAAIELDAEFRLALTGTPLENRLADLWSLCRTTAPGLLGSWDRFRERFAVPIERHADDERRAALARLVRPFLLRRVKREVAPELPPRAEVRVDVVLSTGEREVYDAERLSAAQRLAGVGGDSGFDARFEVLAALTRLRQLVCHPKLHNPESTLPSSKLERLVELVNELRAEGHRTLVFSQFTGLLAHVKTAFDAEGISYLYLDGRTPAGKRRELVDAFQAGTGDAFLISLKAGGTGLNLTGADNVIHLDPWWNPAVEDQASDRAHRIGQTRPVTIYKLVAQDTIEDKILSMQEDKRALVAGVLDGAGAVSTTSTADLLALLADEASITPTNHSSSGAAGPSPSRPASATPRRPRPSSRPPR